MNLKFIFSCIAAGAAIGMLMAPGSGTDTRKKISNSVDDLKARLNRVKSKSAEELEELKEVFQHEIGGLKEDSRRRILEILGATKLAGNKIKEQITL